jgi:hypothetical protein
MVATALESPRFVRRTRLGPNEYRRNFHQIDHDVLAVVTSAEADRVTPLMSKVYLRLVSAPAEFWEREGILYFSAGEDGGRPVKASKVLYGLLGVASATAHKALGWMHEQGIIGYFAGKNGAGIRIFLNRAACSIGLRTAAAGKKILPFERGSNEEARGSTGEPAFNDSFAVSEILDIDLNPHAPKSGADKTKVVRKYPDPRPTSLSTVPQDASGSEGNSARPTLHVEIPMDEIVSRLSRELEPSLQAAAERAAAREHERTREWLENRGLPKAARVAQREAYNVLRKYGVLDGKAAHSSAHAEVGRSAHAQVGPQPLTAEEVAELAQACVAMLEVHGQSIELTLSEMSAESGGFLLPGDAVKVKNKAEVLLAGDDGH